MKLRIFKNSIRLRLRQSEVAQFLEKGSVQERLDIGIGSALSYRLQTGADEKATNVTFHDGSIEVTVPQSIARSWARGSDVAIEAEQQTGASELLRILIEKDFQCMHKEGATEVDAYPNPLLAARVQQAVE